MAQCLPLEIVWSRVKRSQIRAEWALITRGNMDDSMFNHLILSFEPFATFAPQAADV